MNISKAKEQIRNAITAYLTKDDLGNYVIPVEKQIKVPVHEEIVRLFPNLDQTALIAVMRELRTFPDDHDHYVSLQFRMKRQVFHSGEIQMIGKEFHLIVQIQLRAGYREIRRPRTGHAHSVFFL